MADIDDSLDANALRVVKAIADTGSITAAARALGYSQPAVSQQLRRLERRAGMPIVERVGRGVRLTEAGSILARHAAAVTTALDAAPGISPSSGDFAPAGSASPPSPPRRRPWCRA